MQPYATAVPMTASTAGLRLTAQLLVIAHAEKTQVPNLASTLHVPIEYSERSSDGAWFMRTRNSMLLAALALAIGAGLSAVPARAESVVRYGISMADIPLTTGQPDRGAGAYQFTAYTIYDPLLAWEMDVSDRPGKLVPGLATEWTVDDSDKTKWRVTLRKGVKSH